MIDNLPLIYIKIRNLKKDIDYYLDSDTFEIKTEEILNKINEIEMLIKENLKEKNYWIAGISYKELISVLSQYKYIKLIEYQLTYLKEALISIIYELLSFDKNPIVEIRIVNSYSDVIPEIKELIHSFNNYRNDKYSLYNISNDSIEYIEQYLNYIKEQFSLNLINVNDVLYIFRLNFFEGLTNEFHIKRNITIFVDFLVELFNLIKYNNIKVLQFLTDLFNFYNEAKKEISINNDKNYSNPFDFYKLYLTIVDQFIIRILETIQFSSIEFRISFYEKIFRFYFKINDYFKSFILALIISYYNYAIKDFYNSSLYFFRLSDILYKILYDIFDKEKIKYYNDNNYKFIIKLYFFFLNVAFNLYFLDPFNEELKIDLKFNFIVNNFFKKTIFNNRYISIKNIQDVINYIFTLEFKEYLFNKNLLIDFYDFIKFTHFNEFNYEFYSILRNIEDFDSLRDFIREIFKDNENKYSEIFLGILEFIFKEYLVNLN